MKWFKRIILIILLLSILLILALILFEIFLMFANHLTTDRQTKKLTSDLEREISDIEIIRVDAITGNTSGTGNHVECMSVIAFSTELTKSEIEDFLSKYYTFDDCDCFVEMQENGSYIFHLVRSAPFPDNIEGH